MQFSVSTMLVSVTVFLLMSFGFPYWSISPTANHTSVTATNHHTTPDQHREHATFERVLWLSVGPSVDQLGYSSRLADSERLGPEAFWIFPDGTVRILDSVKSRLVDYANGMYVREIPLPVNAHLRDMVVFEGLTYLLIESSEKHVLVVDEDGGVSRTIALPGQWADMVHSLQPRSSGPPLVAGIDGLAVDLDLIATGEFRPDNRYVQAFDVEIQYLRNSSVASVTVNADTLILNGRNLKEITVWHVDNEGILYLSYLDQADTSLVNGDLVVSSFNPHSGVSNVTAIPFDGVWSWPTRWLNVTTDGSIYWFRLLCDGVAIDRVHLGSNYVSAIESLEAEWQLERDNQLEGHAYRVCSIAPDITRQQVFSNSSLILNYSWTYRQANAQPVPSGATKPNWLQAITTFPADVVGIPYCWGGFDSVNTSHHWVAWDDFSDAMAQDAFAGNVNCTGNYKSGTAGLDCGGFVSACLEWNTHFGTEAIWDVKSYSISHNQRLYMDIYIKRSSHVLFYISDQVDGINSREATTTGDAKCKSFARTWTWLSAQGYSLRRLYSIDPNP